MTSQRTGWLVAASIAVLAMLTLSSCGLLNQTHAGSGTASQTTKTVRNIETADAPL